MLALFGVSFLTPLNALFVLAAAVPLGALALTERRADRSGASSGSARLGVAPWCRSRSHSCSSPHSSPSPRHSLWSCARSS